MDPRRATALAVAVAFLGLSALYAYASALRPTPMGLGAIDGGDVGRYVVVSGLVRDVEATRSGGAGFDLVDPVGGAGLRVYVAKASWTAFPDRSRVLPGALLQAEGELQAFGDAVVLQVDDTAQLSLLRPAEENRIPLRTLAANPATFLEMNVTAVGTLFDVREVLDRTRSLVTQGNASIWAFGPETLEGTLDVCGVLEWNLPRSRWELRVEAIGFPADACPPSDLAAVLADPREGNLLGLRNATAVAGELVGTAFELRDGSTAVAGFLWHRPPPLLEEGAFVDFSGTWRYDDGRARYRLESDAATLRAA